MEILCYKEKLLSLNSQNLDLAWFRRPMFSFSAPQISGKDHRSQCPLMLRCWHQQMQLGVCLAQTATLAAQSCRRSLWASKRALQEPLAWAQDLIRVRSTVLHIPEKRLKAHHGLGQEKINY